MASIGTHHLDKFPVLGNKRLFHEISLQEIAKQYPLQHTFTSHPASDKPNVGVGSMANNHSNWDNYNNIHIITTILFKE